MKTDKIVARWKTRAVSEEKIEQVVKVLEACEFTVTQGRRGHWIANHPGLRGSGAFETGRIVINAHHRRQGQVHPNAIRDVLKALRWLEQA
jgi:hypothetical protein